jgi:hypothetical protein
VPVRLRSSLWTLAIWCGADALVRERPPGRRLRSGPNLWHAVSRAQNKLKSVSRLKSRAWECFCLIAFLGLTAWQLFVQPITGLSDNNDFPKVLGPARICKAPLEDVNTFFVSGYDAGPACAWPSGFTSSEILLVRLARFLSRPFTGRYHFDLRASAAVHLAILTVAMALFLCVTRRQSPLVRFLLPPLAILMFTDVAYAAYLNSAYMDNASWVLFLLLVSSAAYGEVRPAGRWIVPVYAIAGILLVFSKSQHAVLGIPFAALAVFYARANRGDAIRRAAWLATAAALLISTAVMPQLTPPEYRTISLYNLIFSRLAPGDRTVLGKLGLDAGYQKWIGTNAFKPDSPLPDPDWSRNFVSQVSFAGIARLYLRHPRIALREIDRELHDSVHSMRPSYMANYRQADGFPPHTAATRFSLWSNLRSRMLANYPYHLLVLYSLPLFAAAIRRVPVFLPLALALVIAGVCEFAICTLADAIDTHRHLFLFQIVTESVILLLARWALESLGRAVRGKGHRP